MTRPVGQGGGAGPTVAAVVAAAVVCGLAGWFFGVVAVPVLANPKLPWIAARASGIGAFVALGALNAVGLAFRRPVTRRGGAHPETLLRLHRSLGPAVVALVTVHVVSLLEDSYSGVTWRALLVPGAATYRPDAVGYGTVAGELMVVVTVTALLAGRPGIRARWAPLHHLAHPVFVLAALHGVTAGSDTPALRWLYAGVSAVVGLSALRLLTGDVAAARVGP